MIWRKVEGAKLLSVGPHLTFIANISWYKFACKLISTLKTKFKRFGQMNLVDVGGGGERGGGGDSLDRKIVE